LDVGLGEYEKNGGWGAEVEARGTYDLTDTKNNCKRESFKQALVKKE
jgi:hypothetical protein